jgi:hypothetical protein
MHYFSSSICGVLSLMWFKRNAFPPIHSHSHLNYYPSDVTKFQTQQDSDSQWRQLVVSESRPTIQARGKGVNW